MKAMILAAGLGSRLRPLTNDRPKALVEVPRGSLPPRTMLDLTLARLREFGIHEVIVNTHHHAEMIESYLAAHQNFGMHIEISREQTLLDTGGGLKQARWFFLDHPAEEGVPHPCEARVRSEDGGDSRVPHPSRAAGFTTTGLRPWDGQGWVGSQNPEASTTACDQREHQRPEAASACMADAFLLHNVDILSTIDLNAMLHHHQKHNALATLATQHRKTSRYLLFDQEGQLCGRQTIPKSGEEIPPQFVRQVTRPEPLAFAGIHIISPHIFSKMTEQGAFSIIPTYLRLAAEGERIQSFNADQYQWRDLGTPASLKDLAS